MDVPVRHRLRVLTKFTRLQTMFEAFFVCVKFHNLLCSGFEDFVRQVIGCQTDSVEKLCATSLTVHQDGDKNSKASKRLRNVPYI